ncbi:T9SS type A sorting domain-containing protein [Balneolales bacterium ANBcel1]|nr:T9SS type A sorting domain-containing protein [Balneolales bacterium ANBcel1]
MKKIYQSLFCGFLLLAFGASTAYADIPQVTARDLNTYDPPLTSLDDLTNHPLVGEEVEVTAIVSSYPRNSGLAGYNPDEGTINRIHVFVVDTTALSQGREGMGLQLVVDGEGLFTLENLDIGDIITFRGALGFFGNTAQFNTDDILTVGNAWEDAEYEKYQELLEPWTVRLTDINEITPTGQGLILENYTTYINQYIKLEDAVVGARDITSLRPWMYVIEDGVIAYNRDTSLRYRNDRHDNYREGYNYRRADVDGNYVPPPPGAVINYSGYAVVNTFDPDNREADGTATMALVAMEDGVRWLGFGDNAIRYTNENLPEFYPYRLRNDLEMIGLPPEIINYQISDYIISSDEQVTISFDVIPGDDDAIIEKVEIFYWVNGEEFVEELAVTGGSYSFTFPAFDDLTTVEFEIRITDNRDINGFLRDGDGDPTDPEATFILKFTVMEQGVNSIQMISETTTGMRGPSTLAGLGALPMDITAVVVADSTNGYIVIHDEANAPAAWSGIFLEPDSLTMSLRRGDRILINSAVIANSNTSPSFANVTYLEDTEFEVLDRGVDYSPLIPVLSTADLTGQEHMGAPYEGMVIRVEDAYIVTNQADAPNSDFGEWSFASGTPDDEHSALRVRNNVAQSDIQIFSTFGTFINNDIKSGAELEFVQGVLGFSHGNPKMTLRSLDDAQPVEDMFYPTRTLLLFNPTNNAEVDVNRALEAMWSESTDRDGDDVTYFFLLSDPEDVLFENYLLKKHSNNDGAENSIRISWETLDDFLAGRGLEDGESEDFIWTVWISDGRDTVQVSTKAASDPVFETLHRNITLQRNITPTSADDSELPRRFALEQNYPNPFNPVTQIRFDVPTDAHVNIAVFDILGRRVMTLVNEQLQAGTHTAAFDGSRLASGMYIYRMEAGSFVQTRKMMLLK